MIEQHVADAAEPLLQRLDARLQRFRDRIVALEAAARRHAHAGVGLARRVGGVRSDLGSPCWPARDRKRSRSRSRAAHRCDQFKSINDGYEHEAGDLVLCRIAHRLQRWEGRPARSDGMAARSSRC
jgi:predicted signal transduction protein with EAL and GGDEF domain